MDEEQALPTMLAYSNNIFSITEKQQMAALKSGFLDSVLSYVK